MTGCRERRDHRRPLAHPPALTPACSPCPARRRGRSRSQPAREQRQRGAVARVGPGFDRLGVGRGPRRRPPLHALAVPIDLAVESRTVLSEYGRRRRSSGRGSGRGWRHDQHSSAGSSSGVSASTCRRGCIPHRRSKGITQLTRAPVTAGTRCYSPPGLFCRVAVGPRPRPQRSRCLMDTAITCDDLSMRSPLILAALKPSWSSP